MTGTTGRSVGMTGMDSGPRPDYTSYSDVLAFLFLLSSVGLVMLATAAFMTRGTAQLPLRIGAGVTALLAVGVRGVDRDRSGPVG
ncbi:MAG: hypothetical protein ACRDTU_03385 [Micromonosporaceae bacterium]